MDLTGIEVVSWDVDGTLYPRGKMVRALLWRALASPWRALVELPGLGRVRRAVEAARRTGGRLAAPLARDRAVEAAWYGPAIARAGLMPGVRELVACFRARGLVQVVLSDYECDYKLRALGLEGAFARTYAAETLGLVKPARELWLAVARDLGVPPERVLHIGDRADTDGGAAEAGCRVVVLGRDVRRLAELTPARDGRAGA